MNTLREIAGSTGQIGAYIAYSSLVTIAECCYGMKRITPALLGAAGAASATVFLSNSIKSIYLRAMGHTNEDQNEGKTIKFKYITYEKPAEKEEESPKTDYSFSILLTPARTALACGLGACITYVFWNAMENSSLYLASLLPVK